MGHDGRWLALAVGLFLATGCSDDTVTQDGAILDQAVEHGGDQSVDLRIPDGGDDAPGDAGEDAGIELGADATEHDAIVDLAADQGVDMLPDVEPDTQPDVLPDVEPDVLPDVLPDIEPDTLPDIEPDTLPDVLPDIEPDIQPDVLPDIQPDVTVIKLVLNEVGPTGPDWIEIYNDGNVTVDLSQYTFQDNGHSPVSFPPGSTVAPGEYFTQMVADSPWPGFGLGKNGDSAIIRDSGGNIVDATSWTSVAEGSSWARLPNLTGSFAQDSTPTFGAANN